MKQSPFDRDGKSLEYGLSVEELFAHVASKYGFKTRAASRYENMRRHIDYYVTDADGKTYSVDVKGMKKLNRYDDDAQDEWLFLEFKNVNGGPGWLYGAADLIAYEMQDRFNFVKRRVLADIAEGLVDMNQQVYRSSEAKYKTYTRKDRRDLVGMIRAIDVPPEKIKTWDKNYVPIL